MSDRSIVSRLKNMYFGWYTVIAGAIIALWGYGSWYYGMSALFTPLLEEMDRRDGGNPRIGATLRIFGGRSLTSTDIEGLLLSLEAFEN
jgi:hypothetical protein